MRLAAYQPRSSLVTQVTDVQRPLHPVIDVHTHLGRWLTNGQWAVADVDDLLAAMAEAGVSSMVNLDGRWGAELEANLRRYDSAHPGRFATFCHVDWEALRHARPEAALERSLLSSAAAGARGLKVWKDLGLRVRDGQGDLVLPDDPRLDALWAAAGDRGMPVIWHVADPAAFFLPVDRHNERFEELSHHPDWSFAQEGPHVRQRLLAALDTVVARHPGTSFVVAHLGAAEDLGWVRALLTARPNVSVDLSARLAEIGRQSRTSARLLTDFPTRVLFGTDTIGPIDLATHRRHYRLLETCDQHFAYSGEPVPPQGRWAVDGLDLPPDVLEAVYRRNAVALLPGLL